MLYDDPTDAGDIVLKNSILWSGPEHHDEIRRIDPESFDNVSYSDVELILGQDSYSGDGNLNQDPEFYLSTYPLAPVTWSSFRIPEFGLCCNAVPVETAPRLDFTGFPRNGDDGWVQMGALEEPYIPDGESCRMKLADISAAAAVLVFVPVALSERLVGSPLFGRADENGRGGGTTCALLIDSPEEPAGDGLVRYYRGCYITSYPGSTLCRLDLWMSSRTDGVYTMQATFREDAYNENVLGSAQAAVTHSGVQHDFKIVSFLFDPVLSAPFSEVVTFDLTVITAPAGTDTDPFYAYQTDSPNGIVKHTEGASPPLDSPRRDAIAIRVYE